MSWVQLVDEQGDRLSVIELDQEAVALAPMPGLDYQLAVAVEFEDPDPTGQPYDDAHASLLAWQASFERALGEGGRLVATITADGVRELVAYLRAPDVIESWESAPPEGLGTHTAGVQLLADPGWLGLREIAGLLGEGEAPLRAPGA